MRWAGVERALLVTNLADPADPDPWPTVRRRVNRVREYLQRQAVEPGAWGIFIERGSENGMVHAHIGQHGKFIPKAALDEASNRAGAGLTTIERVKSSSSLTRYVGKGFSSYVGKGFTATDATANLALNGGRLGHFSRGFFGKSDSGANLGVREAERLAAADDRPAEAGTWVLMREALADPASTPA